MALASFCNSKTLAWSLLTLPLTLACTITTGPAQSPAPGTVAAPPPPPPAPAPAQPQAGNDDNWEGEAEATGKTPPPRDGMARRHARPRDPAAAAAPVNAGDPAPAVRQRTGDPNSPSHKPVGLGSTTEPTSEETRTNDAIASVVRANRQPFRDCYDRAVARDPNLPQGTLTLHFVVDPTGSVKLAELNDPRSTIKTPVVVNCAIAVLKQLKFPASSRGMESTANYPFDFKR